ncbi:MAG: carbamoyltransferase HypF [Lachnospiraceae bacterium]|nr:carbamoyltransferase HypF [Lachnospiraceae bacterium]
MRHVIKIYGIVQGVGFRPTVARLATEYNIKGTVSNKGPYVEVVAEADETSLSEFENAIKTRSPKRAVILKMDVEPGEEWNGSYENKAKAYDETENAGNETETAFHDFQIIESEKKKGEIFISPDIAICDDCKRELYEKGNRRYLHPFINCTCCGPRLTILDKLPYDRVRTSMKEFEMCPDCAREYTTEEDRRFDAQPVCCNNCGPEVFLLDKENPGGIKEKGRDAIIKARQTIKNGGIVAIKGIGGYHLACDATNEDAVGLLRERKKRPMKPFAVMMKDFETVKKYTRFKEISSEMQEMLTGHQKPIVLLKKNDKGDLAESVAPDNPNVGVMLPYAPLHMLLFDYDDGIDMPDVLVMTSANTSGAPICRDEEDALRELSHLSDEILAHNRKIRIRADDTVMDFLENRPYMIRRSRGFAPLPALVDMHAAGINKDEDKEYADEINNYKCVIGIGGELKNTFCIRVNNLCYESPYIGDMEDVRTVGALRETVNRFCDLLEVKPEAVICDLHPKYNTTMVAEELGIPVHKVQHHYAHVLSCMAENNLNGRVIGVSFDGTGYGTDGTIWGGEILLADRSGFERSMCIKPFLQIGGDVSAREGWRVAVSMLYGILKENTQAFTDLTTIDLATRLGLCDANEAKVQMKMHDMNMNAVKSTSVGRLFDAVSAILGIRRASSFEGEASTSLQFAAERFEESFTKEDNEKTLDSLMTEMAYSTMEGYKVGKKDGMPVLPTDVLVADIIQQKIDGASLEKLAYFFHFALAKLVCDGCMMTRKKSGETRVVLTGGCYQNKLLLKLTKKDLESKGFEVFTHSLFPPNDGGIALGQAIWSGFDKGYLGGEKTCV